jgi:CHAD domain-containing protein
LDFPAFHKFRICGKRLRYVMELVVGAFPPEFHDTLYSVVQMLQGKARRVPFCALYHVRQVS